jgi:short-subunit dehydrogenase
MTDYKHILITGASSGIGAALALAYAKEGVTLHLSGRHEERLLEVVSQCRAKGALVHQQTIDVTDEDATTRWIKACDILDPLDLVIANAGISGSTGVIKNEPVEKIREIFSVNVNGTLNTIEPARALMTQRGQGHLVIMSSLASYAPWPGAPAYSASKAAMRVYGEAIYGALRDTGVKVSVICPGFIDTPMTKHNKFFMPFLMKSDEAALLIKAAIDKGVVRYAFPLPMYLIALLPQWLPFGLSQWIIKRFSPK